MSLDKSLRSKDALTRRRNVLSRAERVQALEEEGAWKEGASIFGLPKVKVAQVRRSSKKKKAKEEAAEAAAAPEPAGTPKAAGKG